MAYLIYIKLRVKLNYIKFTCKLSRPWMPLKLENAMLISNVISKTSANVLISFSLQEKNV